MTGKFFVSILSLLIFITAVSANGSSARELVRIAVSDDQNTANAAITKLRGMQQRGLDALFQEFSSEIASFRETSRRTPEWEKIAHAIDAVAMQKDAYASGLFWFTDIEEAKNAAAAANRPILSLRLLGDLNEEFSCANSRLFRSILYANTEISAYLRENYILHWRSVRPAPRITIDFGDGRKIERTVTGNSIHYILDEQGMMIDVLPGLYSPALFTHSLIAGNELFGRISGKNADERHRTAMRYRKSGFDSIKAQRDKAISRAKIRFDEPQRGLDAVSVAPIAVTKMLVTDEISLLRVYDDFARFEPQIDLSGWKKLAGVYAPTTGLDKAAIGFIRRQNRDTGLSEQEFQALIRRVNEFLSIDSTRNDFLYRPQILDWLNHSNYNDLESFNSRVYSEIFRTPDSDPWLGLYSSDIYAALDGNGVMR